MNKGFTIIETIIYIALFSLLLGSTFITAYQLIEGTGKLDAKTTTQSEGNFVMRKFVWALTGMKDITTPSAASPLSTDLSIKKYDGNVVKIRLTAGKIEIKGSADNINYVPITTDNVSVSSLNFQYLGGVGESPAGVTATAVINGVTFSATKYIRK